MKKIFIILFFSYIFCHQGFAENYYFKDCLINENATGDYTIDIEKKLIKVILKRSDGVTQKFTDKIKLITNDRVVSEIIQQKNKEFSTQYFLDAKSKSVVRQIYKREIEIDLIRPEGPPKKMFCSNVKADWYKSEEDVKKEEKIKRIEKLKKTIKAKSSFPECEGEDIKKWTSCRGVYSKDDYKYVGEWKEGKQHGKGIEIWDDGRKFEGEFKKDQKSGQGTFYLPDGTKFSGLYKNGKKNGKGIFLWANGDKYVGSFKNDRIHGQGTYTYVSGKIYSGEFSEGTIIKGKAVYPDGEKYEGEFEFDMPHGYGSYTYSNGGKFVGEFVEGLEYGEGTCVKPSGTSQKCKLENKDIYLGKNKYKISIIGEWAKLEEQPKSRREIIDRFEKTAYEFCSYTGEGNFKFLKKKIDIKEVDETPAFGLEPIYKLGIDAIIKCE